MTTKPFTMMPTFAVFGGLLFAQTPRAQALVMALGANGKQMMAYQWKQRITVWRNGRQAAFRVEEIRFDAIGQPQRITISQSAQKRMGPLVAHKAAEIRDDVQEVMQLAARYTNPQRLAEAIQQGEIWEGATGLRVHARSVMMPGDDLTMNVNSVTSLATQVEIRSQHEGRPVTIAVEYQQLPSGPAMPARMTVQIPADNIVVNVDSFDFVRLASSYLP